VSGWNALFAPRGLPPDIRATLSEALRRALDDERVRSRLLGAGSEIPDEEDRTPEALERLVVSEVARWSAVLKAAATRAGD
jgi:tripartite-type tricarboxylate transporter receptor subunit TctC